MSVSRPDNVQNGWLFFVQRYEQSSAREGKAVERGIKKPSRGERDGYQAFVLNPVGRAEIRAIGKTNLIHSRGKVKGQLQLSPT